MTSSLPALAEHSLRALDWPALELALREHCQTPAGQQLLTGFSWLTELEEVRRRYAEVAEVWTLEEEEERVPLGSIHDLERSLQQAQRGARLELPALVTAGRTLQALEQLRRWLQQRRDRAPLLAELTLDIFLDEDLLRRFRDSFTEQGALSEDCYPELRTLRRRIQQLRQKTRHTLDQMLGSPDLAASLQERFVTERRGRLVLPIKTSHRRKGMGLVHGRSKTGETVFVEPAEVLELQNQLDDSELELEQAIARILRALSQRLGEEAERVREALEVAGEIDAARARAQLGRRLEGVIPDTEQDGVLELREMRHPLLLLQGVDVVANDLLLSSEQPSLILTGPNTGGKTIALKCMGLAALMVHAGIPLPAAPGSRADLFQRVLADVGDLQSVSQALSTFSGHLVILREIHRFAAPSALILLDEIAAGTDPVEGAALARASMEAFLERGARCVVTTHYTELKALGMVDERFQVAGMTHLEGQPSYRVLVGQVGQSHALSTARRLGLPKEVVDRASGLTSSSRQEIGALLDRLEEQEQEHEAIRQRLSALEQDARSRQRSLKEEQKRLEQRLRQLRKEVGGRYEARLMARERELERRMRQARRDQASGQDMRAAHRAVGEVRQEVRADLQDLREALPELKAELGIGDLVTVRSLRKSGKVVALHGKRVEVDLSGMRITVKRSELAGHDGPSPRARPSPPPAPSVEPTAGPRVRTTQNSLDLRGMHVEEALERLEHQLQEQGASLGGWAFVLHGHGTGALKRAVRDWLKRTSWVPTWRPALPEEGGDAWTVVELE